MAVWYEEAKSRPWDLKERDVIFSVASNHLVHSQGGGGEFTAIQKSDLVTAAKYEVYADVEKQFGWVMMCELQCEWLVDQKLWKSLIQAIPQFEELKFPWEDIPWMMRPCAQFNEYMDEQRSFAAYGRVPMMRPALASVIDYIASQSQAPGPDQPQTPATVETREQQLNRMDLMNELMERLHGKRMVFYDCVSYELPIGPAMAALVPPGDMKKICANLPFSVDLLRITIPGLDGCIKLAVTLREQFHGVGFEGDQGRRLGTDIEQVWILLNNWHQQNLSVDPDMRCPLVKIMDQSAMDHARQAKETFELAFPAAQKDWEQDFIVKYVTHSWMSKIGDGMEDVLKTYSKVSDDDMKLVRAMMRWARMQDNLGGLPSLRCWGAVEISGTKWGERYKRLAEEFCKKRDIPCPLSAGFGAVAIPVPAKEDPTTLSPLA